ncbi:Uncharacterised protein [uncultured archaeon]|nr:Uncharacterised protein [uncultured archaeon]
MASCQTALNGPPIHYEGILDVVPFVRKDRDHEVLACRAFVKADGRRCLGPDDGLLGGVEVVAPGVRPKLHVGHGHAQALFDHSCSHGVPGAGIVLWVGYKARRYAKNQGRIQL